MTQVAIGLVIP